MLPWAEGNLGFYLFENDSASRVALIWWPRDAKSAQLRAARAMGDVGIQTRSWSTSRFGFAVYGEAVNEDLTSVAETIAGFYQAAFTDQ